MPARGRSTRMITCMKTQKHFGCLSWPSIARTSQCECNSCSLPETLRILLAKHGDQFIDRIDAETQADPSFAKLLGGVWKNKMRDHIWSFGRAFKLSWIAEDGRYP